jgi:hypothetical protein
LERLATGRAELRRALGGDLGVATDLGLDHLAGDLITDGAGEVLEVGEGDTFGEPVGIEFVAEFSSELFQPSLELAADRSGILAHLAGSSSAGRVRTELGADFVGKPTNPRLGSANHVVRPDRPRGPLGT